MDSPCVSVQKEKTTNSTDSKRLKKNKYKKIAKHRNNKANRPSDRDRQLIPRKRKLQFMPFGRTPWLSDRISVCLGISSSHPPILLSDTRILFGVSGCLSWGHMSPTHFLLPHSVAFRPSTEPFEWTWTGCSFCFPLTTNTTIMSVCPVWPIPVEPVMTRRLPLFFGSPCVHFVVRRQGKTNICGKKCSILTDLRVSPLYSYIK